MGNTNNMISAEELEQLSKQTGLTQDALQKKFNNFKQLDSESKGKPSSGSSQKYAFFLRSLCYIRSLIRAHP